MNKTSIQNNQAEDPHVRGEFVRAFLLLLAGGRSGRQAGSSQRSSDGKGSHCEGEEERGKAPAAEGRGGGGAVFVRAPSQRRSLRRLDRGVGELRDGDRGAHSGGARGGRNLRARPGGEGAGKY